MGRVKAVSVSKTKGTRKTNVSRVVLREDYGIMEDAHAGTKNRQVSLLGDESISKMKAKGLNVGPGDFAENITTEGLDLSKLKVRTKLMIGQDVLLEITQIGKDCHTKCAIYYQAGDCVMPREGVFARVLKGGVVKPGDEIKIVG